VAIRYTSEFEATRSYEKLVQIFSYQPVRLRVEFYNKKLCITLASDSESARIVYQNISFKSRDLVQLQAFDFKNNDARFVHVFSKKNVLFVAKPFRESKFLSICGIEYVDEHF